MLPTGKLRAFSGLFITGGVLGYFIFSSVTLFAQSAVAPKISNIAVTSPTPSTTIVTWDTDIESDSEINYGLDKNYGIARDAFPDKKKHTLTLSDLEPSTIYHFRIGAHDSSGNQALTGDYVLITKSIFTKKELDKIPPEERVYIERAIASIREIKTEDGLKMVAAELGEQAKKVLEAPVIIGTPHVDDVGSDYAVISWASDQDAGSVVNYARDTEYDPDLENPFTSSAGDGEERVKDHQVRIEGLSPGTAYHFQAESEGTLGLKGISRVSTFTTKAQLPVISGFRIIKVEPDAVTLGWRTNIPASGVIEYTDTRTKEVKSVGSPVFATSHNLKIASLRLGTRYSAIVKAENALGEKAVSNPLYFTTVKDVAPPIISKVSSDSTLYPTADAKVQTISAWTTDEPAYCQFFYRAGLNPATEPSGLGEEKDPRADHVQVVVEFLPSTVYQFWIECRDPSNNKSKSEYFVLFTPDKEKSIIDIIMENFSGTFGWVKNIGK